MKDPASKVRRNAADSLGFFPREADKSVAELLPLLRDDNAEVRIATILSLGRLGRNKADVAEAIGKFSGDPDPAVRLNAVVALAMLGKADDSQIPELMKALASKEESTAKAAVRVLSDIGLKKDPSKVLPGVLEVLAGNDDAAARNALKVLWNMKGAAAPALPQIVEFYDHAGDKTRQDVVDTVLAIDHQGDHALVVLNKAIKEAPDPRDRQEALIGLLRFRHMGDRVLDSACVALKDKNRENRILAIKIVRGLGPEAGRALPNLIALTEDPDVAVRTEAISAIGVFRPSPPEVLANLERDLKDNDFRVRIAAAGALRLLARDQPEKVVSLLKQAVDAEPNEATRKAMTAVLKVVSAAAEAKSEGSRDRSSKGGAKP